MSGSEGVGEEADLGLFGKLMPGGFYLYYFSPSQMCYSPFFRMRKPRLRELCIWPSLEELGWVQKPFLQDTHMLKYSECKVTKPGLGAEWSGDQGPVLREAASLSVGPVCGQS